MNNVKRKEHNPIEKNIKKNKTLRSKFKEVKTHNTENDTSP